MLQGRLVFPNIVHISGGVLMQQLNIVARLFTEDIISLTSDTQTILVLGEAIETSMFDSIRGNQKLKVFDFVVSYYLSPCMQVILAWYCTAWALLL